MKASEHPKVAQILESWNVKETIKLLEKLETDNERRKEEEKKAIQAKIDM